MSASPAWHRWSSAAGWIWPFGIPHFFPLFLVYTLVFNQEYPRGMALGFAVTGLVLGLVQCFWRGFKALLITPVFFVLAFAPVPLVIQLAPSKGSLFPLALLAVPWSYGVVLLGQWLLDWWWAGPARTAP